MTHGRLPILAVAALGLALSATALPAAAQSTPPSAAPAPPPAAQPAPDLSEEKLRSFAIAMLEVRRINDAYYPRFQAAQNPTQQQEVRKAAMNEMVAAVKSKGLSVEEYNQIGSAAESDPEVAEQIKGILAKEGKQQ